MSNELLSVLQSLKVRGDHRIWESFHQALRSEWKKDDIEELQRRLDRISNQLSTRVLLNQQSKVVTKLHELAAENRRLEVSRTQDIDHLRGDFKVLFKQISKGLEEESAKNGALFQLSLAAGKGIEYSAEQHVLDKLCFNAMDDRHIAVRPAHANTFS